MLLEEHIAHAERNPFRHAQPGTVSELQHCPVTESELFIERRRLEQPLDLVHAENFGKRPPTLRRLQSLARIADDVPLTEQEAEIAANGGDVSADRSRREP